MVKHMKILFAPRFGRMQGCPSQGNASHKYQVRTFWILSEYLKVLIHPNAAHPGSRSRLRKVIRQPGHLMC